MQRGYLQKTTHVGIQRNLSSAQEDNPDFSGEDMKLVHSTADKYTETHIRNTVPVIAPTCGWERGLHGISAQVLQISVLETKDALSSEESCSNPKRFEKQISHGSVCSAWTRSRVPVCPHLHTCALIMYTCPQMEASVFWCFHIKKTFFVHFVPGNSGGCFETCRFLCSSMHTCLLHTLTERRGSSLQDCIITQRQVLDGERRAWWRQKASPEEMGT